MRALSSPRYTARNTHYLGVAYRFSFAPAPGWNLTATQAHGIDVGSVVKPELDVKAMAALARQFLGLPNPP